METLSRRQAMLRLAAIGGGGLALSAMSPLIAFAGGDDDEERDRERDDRRLPRPVESHIEHIVVVMLENRSFDHLTGWLPGGNGRQVGLRFADAQGVFHSTHHLAPDFQGCAFNDPDHSFNGGRVEYDNGTCDGWLRAGKNDVFSIGYYSRDDLPFFGHIAPRFTSLDRYFCAILGPTFPNRFFQHSAQTNRLSNAAALSTLPTIWDRLADAGVSHRYYFSDLPFLGLWGSKYVPISAPFATFLSDAAAGTLPAVAYIDPSFVGEAAGTSNDDHPHGDLRNGEVFLDKIYQAVTSGPGWRNTVLVINFDEWGGFFDHVPPPVGAVTDLERSLGYTDGLRGFRVPCVVVANIERAAWHVRPHVDPQVRPRRRLPPRRYWPHPAPARARASRARPRRGCRCAICRVPQASPSSVNVAPGPSAPLAARATLNRSHCQPLVTPPSGIGPGQAPKHCTLAAERAISEGDGARTIRDPA